MGSIVVPVSERFNMPFDVSLCHFGGAAGDATWVSSTEYQCISRPADSLVGASDSIFLDFTDHEEVMETSALHTNGPRGPTVKNGELILTYAETMQERSLVVRGPRMAGHLYGGLAHQHFAAHFDLFIGGGLGGEGVSFSLGDLPVSYTHLTLPTRS